MNLRILPIGIIGLLAHVVQGADPNFPEVVYPSFSNELRLAGDNPAAFVSSSVAFFGGTEGVYRPPASSADPTVPRAADTGLQLASCAFGQVFAPRPSANALNAITVEAQKKLYPQMIGDPMGRDQVEGSETAFRYKFLLYSPGGDGIRVDLDKFESWFGDAERVLADEAIAILRSVLQQDPLSTKARNTLLDAYYDLAVAELQSIKMAQTELAKYRLGFDSHSVDGFIIDEEIALHATMRAQYEAVLADYGELFSDRMGINLARVDASAPPGMPLGAYIFRAEQPVRSQMASQFVDADGVLKTVPAYDADLGLGEPEEAPRPLFAAYKDTVTLFSILRDEARVAADLARLYAMRGRRSADPAEDDRSLAYALINRTQNEIQMTQVLLEGMLPDLPLDPTDGSGLTAARNGVQVGLSDLSHVRAFLDGEANLLGFDPDFLVLIQEFPDSTEGNQFDSYDALIRWIRNTDTSPLTYAETTFDRAFTNYEKYQGHADQVDAELSAIHSTYEQRYWEITGYAPDEEGDHLGAPRAGSELWEVERNLEHSDNAVATLEKLNELGSKHEKDANDTLKRANSRIGIINTQYENYQGDIREQRDIITHMSARQAGWQASYEVLADFSGIDWWDWAGVTAAAGVANAIVQTNAERQKGNAQKQLDLAALKWDLATEMADAELVVAQAEDSYNDLARERQSIALQTSDAQRMQAQEIARRAKLIREVQRIRQVQEECEAGVSGRYYADPIHFLRAQNDMIVANLAFAEAQEWVFFTVRALEFKWNKSFVMNYMGKDWETSTLFRLRNFRELEQMVGAIEQFNTINLVGFNREPFIDRISLRDEVFASPPREGPDDGWRIDLESGDRVTVSDLFRRKLSRSRDADGNYIIRLNTFTLEQRGGLLFLGPEYLRDGSVFYAGKYLDKIDWLKVKVVTGQPAGIRQGNLAYGGTCYIRTRVPPCGDPANPLAMPGEYRAFPFRYFLTFDNGQTWETRSAQEDTVKLAYGPTSGEPDPGVINSIYENRFLKERSVATTEWVLSILDKDLQLEQLEDIEIYIRHLFVSRERPHCP